jgi:hypothetical protein|tara:strand:+ start:1486 stop:1770 length:285 start_codon:yes stop_codon:yes gene_type:complete
VIVKSFRNRTVPWYIKSKKDLIAWALVTFRDDKPISNGEFVFELRCTRFGGLLHNLRDEGWDIATVQGKEKGHYVYYLLSMPDEETNNQLKLVQ